MKTTKAQTDISFDESQRAEEAIKELSNPWLFRWRRFREKLKRYTWHWTVALSRIVKRMIDIVLTVPILILLSPIFITTAIAIKVEDPAGPVFFHQQRVGFNRKPFTMHKFRSMYKDAEARKRELMKFNEMQGGVIFKMKDDPRITKVGRFIRRTSIDELPQLFNVLKGEMSLVGPRPPVPGEVDVYERRDEDRLKVKPGITCIWQVSGRSELPFETQVKLDREYIMSKSLWMDIKLLFKTIGAVLSGRGAC